jgi:hypothetical protein
MPTPSSVQTATTHNWIGSQAAFSQLKPQIDPAEYKAYGDEDITGLIEMLGAKNPVQSLQCRHYEDDRLHETVRATGTTGGANTNVVYTVDASYTMTSYPSTFTPYNAASAGSAAPNASGTTTLHPVRANESLLFPDGTRGTVLSVTTTTFTVMPDIEGGSLPTVTNTEDIVLMGVNAGEGGTSPLSLNNRQNTYTALLEILVDSATATGSSMGEQTWVKFEGIDGKDGYLWYYKQQKDTLRKFKNYREQKMVAGEAVTNTTNLAAVDATLLKTEGLYAGATSSNAATTYNIAAGLTLADFEDLVTDNLDQNNGAKENSLMASINTRNSIDGFIRPEMQAGAVQYNSFAGGKDQAVNFGFNGFIVLGYSFMLKTYDLLNNPKMLGANTAFNNSALILPMDKKAYSIGENRTKETVNAFRMNYMQDQTGSRELEEWMTGGTKGVYTNQTDSQTMNLRSHFGAEIFGANRFNVLQGE